MLKSHVKSSIGFYIMNKLIYIKSILDTSYSDAIKQNRFYYLLLGKNKLRKKKKGKYGFFHKSKDKKSKAATAALLTITHKPDSVPKKVLSFI